MGVPALFRWLSRKYPKIVVPVVEEEPVLIPGSDGQPTEIPVDIRKPNPNNFENDCLYLDMNGIVHPCTHPEGKPAPKTEGAMMLEVFKYTERVVNMTRPRKVLLMAIDGVAPRAKMNQQRSRRFRSAEEAKTKAKEKEEAIKEWEAMGKILSDEYKNEEAWDSNAITPGTPFMDLLASSLRYWVAYKMNTDPGWANLQVIISDASVPGEGEHKIMDFVRRQRSQPGYDPNTTHVFYGLDADLIMLSLATHEPNFRILREDVFAQANKRGCHKCGQMGHHSSKCSVTPEQKAEIDKKKASALKPFIFLDVSVLREYLQIELNVPGLPFAFDQERAIDDWVFMIFFVGNDFLPHLPSLEIREGAIDMLLQIWRTNLPQMGGYLTDNGKVDLDKAQFIMDGLAEREDAIFRKRRQDEERQSSIDKEKRRRIEGDQQPADSASMRNGVGYVPVIQPTQTNTSSSHANVEPSKPEKVASTAAPVFSGSDASGSQTANGGVALQTAVPLPSKPAVGKASNNPLFVKSGRRDGNAPVRGRLGAKGAASATDPALNLVQNRAAMRKANLSAAEMLKAELMGGTVGSAAAETDESATMVSAQDIAKENGDVKVNDGTVSVHEPDGTQDVLRTDTAAVVEEDVEQDVPDSAVNGEGAALAADQEMENKSADDPNASTETRGKKRSADEAEIPATRTQALMEEVKEESGIATPEDGSSSSSDDDDDDVDATFVSEAPSSGSPVKPLAGVSATAPAPLKMLGGNMVEQEDTVKLWEPGYKERYYEQKFNIKIEDVEFRRNCAKAYVEGLSWVLAYYYTGCPSWTWYYPYHFAPFASDFTDLKSMEVNFEEGKPFRPFEQLMGVFPAASRVHLPDPFQKLMTDEDSEIIDFYPEEFSIDMNGKKMLWQGVALLPFIDETRLLDAMAKKYPELSEEEHRRNGVGNEVIFVNEENKLYDQISSLYMKRKVEAPVPMDAEASRGIRGQILPNPDCIPSSTFTSPLPDENLSDIQNDRSITANYTMPPQAVTHRSMLLPGYRPMRRVLTPEDIDDIRRGVSGEQRGPRRGAAGDGFHSQRRNIEGPGHAAPRRDARDVVDPRRRSGGYGQSSSWEGGSQQQQYGSNNGGGRDSPYSGYANNQNRSGYNSPASYGGNSGYNNQLPQQPPRPQSGYGGYGGGSSSYGGYGQSGQSPYRPPANPAPSYGSSASYGAPYQPPPPAHSYGQPPQSGYGGPPQHGGYQPPSQYGGYGGYGSAQPPPGQGYQPPPQQQPYSNRGGILPPHLQNGQHQRWGGR